MIRIIFTIVAILLTTMVFSQTEKVNNFASYVNGGKVVEDNNKNIYYMSQSWYSNQAFSTFDSLSNSIVKLSYDGKIKARKTIKPISFLPYFYPDFPNTFPVVISSRLPFFNFNSGGNNLDILMTVLQDNSDSILFRTLHLEVDTNLTLIKQHPFQNENMNKLMNGEFYNDTLAFGVFLNLFDGFMYPFRINLNSNSVNKIKEGRTIPANSYQRSDPFPINDSLCIYSLGANLNKVNFSSMKIELITDCFACWPQLITPTWPHISKTDSSFIIVGSNMDSLMVFDAKNASLNLNEYTFSGKKVSYQIIPGNHKFQRLESNIVAENEDFIYILSDNYDSTDQDLFYLSYFSTEVDLKLTKVSKNGDLIWEKVFGEFSKRSPISMGLFSISDNRLLMVHDEWDHVSHPNYFIKDLVFTILNEDGEILSTNKHRVSENHGFIVYPNPTNSANPLNVVLPPGMVGRLQIQLVGLIGQVGKTYTQTLANGQTQLQLNLNGVASGAYILHVANQGGEQFSVPLVVSE